ncbi:unnamed protein product [Dracunculus medinensis]|uniref:Dolichyl-diphosphooligosaccharide--protein glycosyltransferase subunit 4 n=1 Tax=Dracunculus medinensis TaxID=318479 RepID=A0A0N4UB45_DRAME|nr:unnamed protein product [Dracunculus medinensis]
MHLKIRENNILYIIIVYFYISVILFNLNELKQINQKASFLRIKPINRTVLIKMITDVQLAVFSNLVGVSIFALVILFHYVVVNNPKRSKEHLGGNLKLFIRSNIC